MPPVPRSDAMVYSASDVWRAGSACAGSCTARPPKGWEAWFSACAATLWDAVEVTASGVVHGNGVVVRRALACHTELIDPSAFFVPGEPPANEQGCVNGDHYIGYGTSTVQPTGYFKVHCFADDECRKTATSFWLNEARGSAKPNACWKVGSMNHRRVLVWLLMRDVRAGEELLVSYNK
jgi:hypothetical protein